MTVTLFGYLILISKDFTILFSLLCLVLVSIEEIYQTLHTVFDYCARVLFLTHLSVLGNVVKTRPLLFDILLQHETSHACVTQRKPITHCNYLMVIGNHTVPFSWICDRTIPLG